MALKKFYLLLPMLKFFLVLSSAAARQNFAKKSVFWPRLSAASSLRLAFFSSLLTQSVLLRLLLLNERCVYNIVTRHSYP